MSATSLRIATRASRLALWQANHVAGLLRAAANVAVEIVHVSTVGDRDQRESLQQIGGEGVFTREVQLAVLDGRADIAVHSLKDLPTIAAAGMTLAAVPERGPTGDALLLPKIASQTGSVADLPANARIGTSSLRRQAQLLHLRSDLQLLPVRGNVETRIAKLDAGEYQALVLAEAGLVRLGLEGRISSRLLPPDMYPAVGQGALGIECRADDDSTRDLLQSINHPDTLAAVTAERSLLAELRAGCHAPVGAASKVNRSNLELEGVVLSRDGVQRLVAQGTASADKAVELGKRVAEDLLRQGAGALIQ